MSGQGTELAASAGRRPAISSGTATLLRLSPAPAGAAPGKADGRVVFLAINVNQRYDRVADVGPHGTERYTAAPPAEPAGSSTAYLPPGEISGWGKGIAQVVRVMLG